MKSALQIRFISYNHQINIYTPQRHIYRFSPSTSDKQKQKNKIQHDVLPTYKKKSIIIQKCIIDSTTITTTNNIYNNERRTIKKRTIN